MVGCTIFTLTFCLCVHVSVVAAGGVDGGGGFGTASGWAIMYTICQVFLVVFEHGSARPDN